MSLRGRTILEITMGVLGALAVTSEYGAGTIVPSLSAVPDRDRLLAAKALTIAGISLGSGLAASTSGFVAGQALFARRGVPHDTLRTPGSARAVLGGSLHATAAAPLGLGIGIHTRSTAGAVSTIFAAEWLVPGIGPAFPKPLPDLLTKYWLTEAGASIFATRPDPKLLSPWTGLGVMAASTAAVLGSALAAFRRRDG
jgi:ABC-2 type transport system permease protein